MIRPSPSYDVNNESRFRADAEQRDEKNLKRDRAIPSFLMNDDDGTVKRISLVGGVLTVTPV